MWMFCVFFFFIFVSILFFFFFFFSSRRRHTRCSRDWSSDVCSSDLLYKIASLERQIDLINAGDHPRRIKRRDLVEDLPCREGTAADDTLLGNDSARSEERRVGKECRSRRSA